jgi:hypothetical protein
MDTMHNSRKYWNDDSRRGKSRGSESEGPSWQCSTNWCQEEILALISCKHKEQTYLKNPLIQEWTWFLQQKIGTRY